jgi:hypothetical protein
MSAKRPMLNINPNFEKAYARAIAAIRSKLIPKNVLNLLRKKI